MNYSLAEHLRPVGMFDYIDELARVYVAQHYLFAAFLIVALILVIVWHHWKKEGMYIGSNGQLVQILKDNNANKLNESFDNLQNNRYDHSVMNCDNQSIEEKSLPWMSADAKEGFAVDDRMLTKAGMGL